MIRFPFNFTESFNTPACTTISGFSSDQGTNLNCNYLDNVRLLTIEEGFPTTFTELQFSVSGVTNPPFANETNYFKVESFSRSGGEFIPLESSNDFITITPTPGALSGETMSLSNKVVGSYSTLTVEMTTQNQIPQDGSIRIFFPKWNPFASTTSQMESYISSSTSPGSVPCREDFVTSGTNLDCVLTNYQTYDILEVKFDGYLSEDIAALSTLSIVIEDTRAPPTTSPISGFEFSTFNIDGMLIDQSDSSTEITLKADTPATDSSSSMHVTSSDPSINMLSDLTLQI